MPAEVVERPRIYHLRMARGETQKEFARFIGIHHITLSQLENWKTEPGDEVAEKLAKALKTTKGSVIDEYADAKRRAS